MFGMKLLNWLKMTLKKPTKTTDKKGKPAKAQPAVVTPKKEFVPQEVIEHLALREGVVAKVYKDSLGFLTGGVGHLLTEDEKKRFKLGDSLSAEQINKWLEKDSVKAYTAALEQAKELGLETDQVVVKALTAVNFQLGTAWRDKFKNTWKTIKLKDYTRAIMKLQKTLWFQQTPVRVRDFISVLQYLGGK